MSRKASTDSAPMPSATRSGVPNRLPSTGMLWPFGFSNSSAGPLARRVRSQISVISRCGSIALRDALELAACFELREEIAEVGVFHLRMHACTKLAILRKASLHKNSHIISAYFFSSGARVSTNDGRWLMAANQFASFGC